MNKIKAFTASMFLLLALCSISDAQLITPRPVADLITKASLNCSAPLQNLQQLLFQVGGSDDTLTQFFIKLANDLLSGASLPDLVKNLTNFLVDVTIGDMAPADPTFVPRLATLVAGLLTCLFAP